MFRKIIGIFVLLSFIGVFGQETYEKGIIIDSIKVIGATDESFALYLPKNYNAKELSPTVFIFEPAARGKIGIQPFMEAAEAYGYILICSNNNRNGPYERNFEIANRLFVQVSSSFNIKEKEIYVSGFSGGSRLASAIAVLTNQIAGVVACGAGFSPILEHRPSTQDFAYVGLCGNQDFNYREMINTKNYLQKAKFRNTLFTFEGNHRWPSGENVKQAFDWLEIMAHIKGIKKLENGFILEKYNQDYKAAVSFEADGKVLKAVETYERMVFTYPSFYEIDSIGLKLARLRGNKKHKNSVKNLAKAFRLEEQLTRKFRTRFLIDFTHPEKADLGWWSVEVSKIDKYKKNTLSGVMNNMAGRMKYTVFAMAVSRTNPNLYTITESQKKFCNAVCKLIYPKFQPRS